MSGVTASTYIIAGASLAGTIAAAGASYIQGQKTQSAQKEASDQAAQAAATTAAQADQANNRANAKSPDTAAMLSNNQQMANQGVGSTQVSGPAGIDPTSLSLGKSTLLGS